MNEYTGQDIAAIIGAVFSGLAALLGGAAVIVGLWAKMKADANAHELAMHRKLMAEDFAVVKTDIADVKHATNSMKDALVLAAGREGETKGRADEKADQVAISDKAEKIAAQQSTGQAAGQIKVDSAEITVDKAEIAVNKPTR